jgi:hypothetical protein
MASRYRSAATITKSWRIEMLILIVGAVSVGCFACYLILRLGR